MDSTVASERGIAGVGSPAVNTRWSSGPQNWKRAAIFASSSASLDRSHGCPFMRRAADGYAVCSRVTADWTREGEEDDIVTLAENSRQASATA